MALVHASYFTDPCCPWSWAIEPALRRLEVEFGDQVRFTYVMAGLHRELQDGREPAAEWLDAAASSRMPVDVRLWLDSPPRSSYPACMAVKAAAEQGPAVAGRFLRVLREGFACRRLRLDRSEALLDQARGQDSLDLQRFTVGLGSHAIVEAFGADLEQARAGDSDGERITLPSIDFEGEGGERHEAHGSSSYGDYRDAVIACGAVPGGSPAPDVEQALAHFESMATAEVAEVCRLPGPRAAAELWRLASEWRVRSEAVGSGELWSLA